MQWSSHVGGCDPPTAFSKRATPPIIYPAISSVLGVMKKHPFLLEIPFSANNLFSWLPAASRQRSARSPLPLCTNKELAAERARAAGRRGNALHATTTAESTASSSQRASPQHPNSRDPPSGTRLAPCSRRHPTGRFITSHSLLIPFEAAGLQVSPPIPTWLPAISTYLPWHSLPDAPCLGSLTFNLEAKAHIN